MAARKRKYIIQLVGCNIVIMDIETGDKDIYNSFDVEPGCIVVSGSVSTTIDRDCIVNEADLDQIFDDFCNCSEVAPPPDVMVNVGDVEIIGEVQVNKNIPVQYKDEDGNIITLQVCTKPDGTVIGYYGNATGSAMQMGSPEDAGFTPCEDEEKERFINPTPCVMYAVDDIKKEEPINLIEYFDCDKNEFVQFEQGTEVIEENIINTENYTKMSNFAGFPPSLPAEKSVEKTVEICGPGATGTIQDVLDAAIAAGALIDGVAPDGIVALEIIGEYKGQNCAGAVLTSNGPTEYGTTPVSIDAGQKFCEKLTYADEDCDGLADACYDLTTPLVIPAGAGIIANAILVLCDDDPTTPAGGEGEGEGE